MSQNDKNARAQQPPAAVEAQKVTEVRPLGFEAVKLSDVGRLRPHNEDYTDYFVPPDPRQLAQKGALYLVADGMGGHQAGEVASQGAVEQVIQQYYSDTTHDVSTSLVRAIRVANQHLYEQAQADTSKTGMGTTLVAAVVLGRKVYVANVGDSRAYLINRKGISQITEDHSWVDEQVRAGLLTPEQARRHPQRNLVTRALGSRPAVEVDLFEGEIGEGDILLLCTDGLTGPVEDPEIAAVIQAHPPDEAAHLLVDQANERGGSDNITLLIVRAGQKLPVVAAPPPVAAVEAKPARALPLIPILGGLTAVLVLVLAGLVLVPLLSKNKTTPTPTLTPGMTDTALPPTAPPVASEEPQPTSQTGEPPTEMPTQAASPTVEQTPSGPTATLAATYTATPQPTDTPRPSDTPLLPTSTTRPTDPEATLIEPLDGTELHGEVLFRWSYPRSLPRNKQFQVLIWREGDAEHNGAAAYTSDLEQRINLDEIPQVHDSGPSAYWWSVVVVNSRTGERTSREATPRSWTYVVPSPANTTTPKPTVTGGAPKGEGD
jgi:serine/threonine protein phosphatase PrpC